MMNIGDKTCKYAFIYNQLRPDNEEQIAYAQAFLTNCRAQRAILRGAKLYDTAFATAKLEEWQLDDAAPKPDCIENEPIVHGWVITSSVQLWPSKLMSWYLVEGYSMFKPQESLNARALVNVELLDECIGA